MDKLNNIFSKIILPIYWAFLTYMLLRPSGGSKSIWFIIPHIDKVVHLVIFTILGLCLRLAIPKQTTSIYFQLIFAYALLTEILQKIMKVGRSLEILDILADMLGAVLAFYIYKAIQKRIS